MFLQREVFHSYTPKLSSFKFSTTMKIVSGQHFIFLCILESPIKLYIYIYIYIIFWIGTASILQVYNIFFCLAVNGLRLWIPPWIRFLLATPDILSRGGRSGTCSGSVRVYLGFGFSGLKILASFGYF